ncbi:MAG: RNA polymerase sigma factor [Bacteroidota bacterium]
MIEQLWKTHSDSLYHYLSSRTGNAATADDLVQDVFHKVLRYRDQLPEIDNQKAWLYRIARNALIDYTRKRKPEPTEELLIPEWDSEAGSAPPVEGIAECLIDLIEEYDDEQQILFKHIFTDALSQKEAAEMLDIPYSTLKSRVQKARKEIMDAFYTRCCQLQRNSDGEIIGCIPVTDTSPSTC